MELVLILAALFLVFRGLNRRATSSDSGAIVAPVGWSEGTNWRVVAPLARADVRRLLRHPAFIAGVMLSPLILLAATQDPGSWRAASAGIALGLVPLGWLTIIATNLVALRPSRTGADELFAALPAPQPVRSSALLAAAVGPVIVATFLALAWVGLLDRRADELRGAPQWAEIAAGLIIVAGSVCVGVAVARWLPGAGFGMLAALATIVIQARFLDVATWPWNRSAGDPLRFLGFLAATSSVGGEFLEPRPAGWHLLYLSGLVVVMAGVALTRDGWRGPGGAVVAAGVLVAAGAGWVQTRPLTGTRLDETVAFLADPVAHQVCEESAGVRYCAYPEFRADIAEWSERVDATLALVPAATEGDRPPLDVIQRVAAVVGNSACSPRPFEHTLPPEVAARLTPAVLWPADGQVHPPLRPEAFPCSDTDVHGFFLAGQTGAWAVGLPSAPHGRNERCTASGQARSVIALWAAAAASPGGAQTLRGVVEDGAGASSLLITFPGWNSPPMWGVDFAVADARIALALLQLPAADVRAAVERDWARWSDASTPSSALARELGIDVEGEATTPAPAGDAACP